MIVADGKGHQRYGGQLVVVQRAGTNQGTFTGKKKRKETMKPGGDFELFTPLRAVIGGQGQMDRQRDGRLALLGFESSDLIKVICHSISEMMLFMRLLQLYKPRDRFG